MESDCAVGELERVLKDRMERSFAELEPDWQERVRSEAARVACAKRRRAGLLKSRR